MNKDERMFYIKNATLLATLTVALDNLKKHEWFGIEMTETGGVIGFEVLLNEDHTKRASIIVPSEILTKKDAVEITSRTKQLLKMKGFVESGIHIASNSTTH